MAPYVQIEAIKPIPPSLATLRACPCRPFATKALVLTRPLSKFNLGLLLHGPERVIRMRLRGVSGRRCIIAAVARAKQDRVSESDASEEVDKGHQSSPQGETDMDTQQKANQLRKRILFGLGIGISVGGVVLAGGWVFTVALASAVLLVTSKREP